MFTPTSWCVLEKNDTGTIPCSSRAKLLTNFPVLPVS